MQCVNGHQNPDTNSFCGVCGASAAVVAPPVQNPGFQPGYTPQAPSGLVQVPVIGTVQVASVGQRLAARAIDLGILIVSYFALTFIMTILVQIFDASLYLFPVVGLLWLIFWLLYEWLFIAYRGATLGKAAMGIIVVDQRNGARLGLGSSFVRQLIPWVGALILFIGTLLVYLSPLFDNSGRMQGWHDKAAGDLVILKAR